MSGYPRVLIVGTVPYNRKTTARAFDSYFHGWDESCMAQIFSNTKTPPKGHCGTLFQITDQRILKKRFSRSLQTGRVFLREELPSEWVDSDLEVGSTLFSKLYQIGSASNVYTHIARGLLWKEKFWHSQELDEWLDKFCPECVFLSFSNDFFLLEIALYVSQKFDIPIVSAIGDDYCFCNEGTKNPLSIYYKKKYLKLVKQVFARGGWAIYISDKIRNKYNQFFGIKGTTVYLTSEMSRRDFVPINSDNPVVSYFGNIRLGRNRSLCEVATALGSIDSTFALDVYSNEKDEQFIGPLISHPNIVFHGSIPYDEVVARTMSSDILVAVEGTDEKDIEITRYSLSTKAADSISSGVSVFAYGSIECGLIEYLKSTKCCCVCLNREELQPTLTRLINDVRLQERYYEVGSLISERNHSLRNSTALTIQTIRDAIVDWRNCIGRDDNGRS